MSFSAQDRPKILDTLEKEYFDIIVIGGGITGAGIALDAASRGFKTALVEKGDFASGTSSKSTKLIHGGLRYLKQMEFGLVREVGKERAIVHKIAPHLVRPEKMLLPLITDGNYGSIVASVGLMVYDVLADVEVEDQRKMLSKEETLKLEPLLKKEVVEGSGLYAEYQTDDFRLVVEIIKASRKYQAVPINYVEVIEVLEKGGKACGTKCRDQITGRELNIYADYVINATGPWVDDVRGQKEEIEGKSLFLTKGVHLVVPHDRLPINHALYFDIADGRMMFAIPKKEVTYIGTTDTAYSGDPSHASTTKEDVDYLINAVNHMFPSVNLSVEDIQSSWAGVRPLISEKGKSASEISRKDELFIAKNGMVSIAGGKLTGYRQMAKKAVMTIIEKKEKSTGIAKKRKCKTRKIKLPGNEFKNYKAVIKLKAELSDFYQSFDKKAIDYLVDLYGAQASQILSDSSKMEGNNLAEAVLESEVVFCLENEMVMTLLDFYERRTGRLYFDIESVKKTMNRVAAVFSKFHQWDDKRKALELVQLELALTRRVTFL